MKSVLIGVLLTIIAITCFLLYAMVLPNGWFLFAGIISLLGIGDLISVTNDGESGEKSKKDSTNPSVMDLYNKK